MHPQLQAEQSAFSQHQPMEQDDTGIANPANNYHQPQHLPNSYMDFPKVTQSCGSVDDLTFLPLMYTSFTSCPLLSFQGMPMSMYGGTMLPPHPPMAEGPGGPMYNGLHAGDPAWSPIIKVVPNNADNSDPQQQVMSSFMRLITCSEFCCQACISAISLIQYFTTVVLTSAPYWSSFPSGVAWYLGTSCGQCAPEPRQLDSVHSNQTHTA